MQIAFKKRPTSFYGHLIRLYTLGPYSHCELVFPGGQCFSSSEEDGGVRFKALDLDPRTWDVVDLPLDTDTRLAVYRFCRDELTTGGEQTGYDWRGIAFSFLPIPISWQSKDKWFCSEICAAALQVGGYLRGYTPASLSPNGLYKALKKEVATWRG